MPVWRGRSSPVMNLGTFVVCTLLCWLVIPIFVALWKWLEIRCKVYELTTQRLRISQGVLTKVTEELELYRVKDIAVVEPLLLRFFGLGNIVLTTSDDSAPVVILEAIANVNGLRDDLRKSVEQCRQVRGVRVAEME